MIITIHRNPVVCGVTLLGMDHVETLGGSLESIAWQKAGIFKVSRSVNSCAAQCLG